MPTVFDGELLSSRLLEKKVLHQFVRICNRLLCSAGLYTTESNNTILMMYTHVLKMKNANNLRSNFEAMLR